MFIILPFIICLPFPSRQKYLSIRFTNGSQVPGRQPFSQ
jgi:hypothetical protein